MRPIPTIDQIQSGDPGALGVAVTLAERANPRFQQTLAGLRSSAGRAFRVGFTGPPGAGKSSLIREVVRRIRQGGERAAIVASDPVSPLTGGALLGDRYRMAGVADDPGVFFRSIAHRGAAGEPCPAACLAADILDSAGFPWILLETVGTGQADVHALRGAHLKVFVHAPEGGDQIQMLKAGLQEVADLHVVGKCDRPGARAWAVELESALSGSRGGTARVLAVSAATGEGVDALVEELRARREAFRKEIIP